MTRQLRPYRGWIALAALLGLLAAAAGSLDPLFYRYLLDLVVRAAAGGGPAAPLRAAALAIAGLCAVNAAQQVLQAGLTLAANKVRFAATFALSRRLLARMLHQPLSRHVSGGEEQGTGAVMTRMDRGVGALGQLTGDLLQSLLPNLANLALIGALMFRLTPRLSWVALAPLPLFLWATLRATAAGVAAEEQIQDGWRRLYRRVYEMLSAIKTLKSLGGESGELARYDGGARAIFARLWRLTRLDAGYGAMRGVLAAAGRAGVLLYGAALVLEHRMTPGTWIAAVTYAGMIYTPLTGLTGVYTALSTHLVTAGAALDIPETAEPAEEGCPPPSLRGEVVFERVSFAYGGEADAAADGAARVGANAAAPSVLREVSFRIAPGEIVALTGPSGGGKTTIADLLLRFYRPSAGAIRLDGRDSNTLPLDWLRTQMAAVLQDAVLFAGTIAENIAFGRPEAELEAIRAAARAAQAEEFILRLPAGYATHIGERGARLSGGQRQRLAIARALLRDAPILIFDEASSHLDGESESALNAALVAALAGRTVLLITHRRSSLMLAHRVLVVANGRLVESRPADLLAADTLRAGRLPSARGAAAPAAAPAGHAVPEFEESPA